MTPSDFASDLRWLGTSEKGFVGQVGVSALVLLSDWVAEHADLLDLDFDHITRL